MNVSAPAVAGAGQILTIDPSVYAWVHHTKLELVSCLVSLRKLGKYQFVVVRKNSNDAMASSLSKDIL